MTVLRGDCQASPAHAVALEKNSENREERLKLSNQQWLTSVECKLFEHILSSQIIKYLTSNNILYANQHGFQRGLSCETQLFELTTDIHDSQHKLLKTDVISIDFAKAFDRVPHNRLIHKMENIKIESNVIRWFKKYLTNRHQAVIIEDLQSSFQVVKSGVPQGSVLGPTFFLISINYIAVDNNSSVRLFADECVLYRRVTNRSSSIELQNDLRKREKWCADWLMSINTKKLVMRFTTRNEVRLFNYTLNSINIEPVTSFIYLGVHLTRNLSWKTHIDFILGDTYRQGRCWVNLHPAPRKFVTP